jgi:hypothetical protein
VEDSSKIDEVLSQTSYSQTSSKASKTTRKTKERKSTKTTKDTDGDTIDISTATQPALMKLTLSKLKDLCKANKVKGYSKMKTKETLVAFILENRINE